MTPMIQMLMKDDHGNTVGTINPEADVHGIADDDKVSMRTAAITSMAVRPFEDKPEDGYAQMFIDWAEGKDCTYRDHECAVKAQSRKAAMLERVKQALLANQVKIARKVGQDARAAIESLVMEVRAHGSANWSGYTNSATDEKIAVAMRAARALEMLFPR